MSMTCFVLFGYELIDSQSFTLPNTYFQGPIKFIILVSFDDLKSSYRIITQAVNIGCAHISEFI